MPIYEYTCEKCGKDFDHLAKSMAASSDKVSCPACGAGKTKRKLSVVAVQGGSARPSASGGGGHVHSSMCGCGRPHGSCGMN